VFFLTGERIIETDVLVLGGGLAGCMAAIRMSLPLWMRPVTKRVK